ncbi:hypothetical protein RYO59_001605 [Thermosynechococcaceae cyanobacterium Okahandja]
MLSVKKHHPDVSANKHISLLICLPVFLCLGIAPAMAEGYTDEFKSAFRVACVDAIQQNVEGQQEKVIQEYCQCYINELEAKIAFQELTLLSSVLASPENKNFNDMVNEFNTKASPELKKGLMDAAQLCAARALQVK